MSFTYLDNMHNKCYIQYSASGIKKNVRKFSLWWKMSFFFFFFTGYYTSLGRNEVLVGIALSGRQRLIFLSILFML